MNAIQSRLPAADYFAWPAMNISRLKELKRSPLHYLHRLTVPRESAAMTLGTAAHCATLEPERFATQYAVWTRRTDGGALAPRRGKEWDAFVAGVSGKTVITEAECAVAQAIAAAVRGNALAMPFLESGEPEVSLQWQLRERACKGRVDWLTRDDDGPVVVGLKTARDCRHYAFGSSAAKLGYHLQWAWYHDGYEAITGTAPSMVEIVVESEAPHAVAVYRIPPDVIQQGRDEYLRLLDTLAECEASGHWPGPVPAIEWLTLPTWAYDSDDEDVDALGLT